MTTGLWTRKTIEVAAMNTPVSVASTGDKASLVTGAPINIVRWGFTVTTTLTGAPVFKMDKRPVAGSDAGRVTGAVVAGVVTAGGGTLTPGTLAAGKVGFINVNTPASGPGLGLTGGGFQLNPGEEVVIQVATAAGAGLGVFFIDFEEIPFVGDATVGSAANNSSSNRIFNATKFTS